MDEKQICVDVMTADVLKLVVGFLLTSVLGGVLGFYFQNRTWRRQNDIRLVEADQATTTKLFEELSALMDKRLYRMRQVHWKLKNGDTPVEAVEEHMRRYREILYEWNDSLNRNLALTETYFGSDIRKELEGTIYEEFRRIGELLESRYKSRQRGEEGGNWQKTANDLTKLGSQIYAINVQMSQSIQLLHKGLHRDRMNVHVPSRVPNPAARADA
jgi:hypothetical protein